MVFHNLRLPTFAFVLAINVALPVAQENNARRDFKRGDFAKLRWLEGTWQGSGGGYDAFFERYHFVNDSTIEMTAFKDGTLTAVGSRSIIALRAGRIINESGSGRHEASKLTGNIVQFIPIRGATGSFMFQRMARDRWTATLQPRGNAKRTVYEMKRKQ
jgi:hypothetical protein